jgi:polyisoprenoid-binding protein YceI
MKLLRPMFCLMFFAAAAVPAADTYKLDPVHTQVLFTVDHLGFSKSTGKFHVKDGTITLDQKDPSKSSVNATIDVASLNMGDATWEAHLKDKNFFNSQQYPTMEFRSTSVTAKDSNNLTVKGDLTILGVTKPATLDVKVNRVADHPMTKKPHAGFSAVTKIKRSDFGMKYGIPAVGDDTEIRLEVEAAKAE